MTVFGESAGAFDTVSMLLAPAAKDLFHRAIIQSGGIRMVSEATAENFSDANIPGDPFSSKEVVNQLLIADKKSDTREATKALQHQMSKAELDAYFRSKNNDPLLSVCQTEKRT